MRTGPLPDPFPGMSAEWLRARLTALMESDAIPGGAQTHVAIAPGMFHEFAEISGGDLDKKKKNLIYALWLREEEGFYNPFDRGGVTESVFL